jgi:hypothetical protein
MEQSISVGRAAIEPLLIAQHVQSVMLHHSSHHSCPL